MKNLLLLMIWSCGLSLSLAQEKKEYHIISIGFYNLENLFDVYDDPNTFDEDFTSKGKEKWTESTYREKLGKMAFTISQIGQQETYLPPAILGVCEIENRDVLEDLIKEPALLPFNYGIVHFESPDLRGIDVGLLYRQDLFKPNNVESHELVLYDNRDPGKRVYTRDQLVVSGNLDGELVHFIVNHWPSRSGGEKYSSPKREAAAFLNKRIIDSIQKKDPYAKIITMGDFNDDPHNKSLSKILNAKPKRADLQLKDMYNPMATISEKGIGSLAYRDGWNLFDQIIVSQGLLSNEGYNFYKAEVFNPGFLRTPTGQYRGYPFRSFGGGGYSGGFSDHFPVYVLLIKRKN